MRVSGGPWRWACRDRPWPPGIAPGARLVLQERPTDGLRRIALQYAHEELSQATQNWSKSRQLGSGSYGAVFKGEMKDGTQVAIKMIDLGALKSSGQPGAHIDLSGTQLRTEDMAGFDQEVATLSKSRAQFPIPCELY